MFFFCLEIQSKKQGPAVLPSSPTLGGLGIGAEASSSGSLSSAEQQRPDWTPAGLRSFSEEQDEAASRSESEEHGSAEASEARSESGVVRRERGAWNRCVPCKPLCLDASQFLMRKFL